MAYRPIKAHRTFPKSEVMIRLLPEGETTVRIVEARRRTVTNVLGASYWRRWQEAERIEEQGHLGLDEETINEVEHLRERMRKDGVL